ASLAVTAPPRGRAVHGGVGDEAAARTAGAAYAVAASRSVRSTAARAVGSSPALLAARPP
ncbi:hypothetical protein, partial [Streptomyces griseoloalbus]|uniref:hypothetical protein n=1 Tax=Streptomyces griseoloalbus TaxID=67303 RepID=UPI00402AF2AB